jgi:1,4-dihydroxy-6-naphthoate synthase
MSEPLDIAISPCPNDTFAFYGLKDNPAYRLHFLDIEELNRALLAKKFAVAKGSFAIMKKLSPEFTFADSGAAIGRGVGPVIVGKIHPGARVALPGENTTAHLLFRYWVSKQQHLHDLEIVQMPFFEMLPSMKSGQTDSAVLIHEGRFVYAAEGLSLVQDLGAFWEQEEKAMIPLGCIYVQNGLADSIRERLNADLMQSVKASREHFGSRSSTYTQEILPYMQLHAQEQSIAVVEAHVNTYVTDDTLKLRPEALESITAFSKYCLPL